MRPARSITRRTFIRATAYSTAMLAVSRLPAPSAATTGAATGGALRVLAAREAAILTAIGERIVDSDADMPPFRDTAAIATIDTALLHLERDAQELLRWTLALFEYGPFLHEFRLRRFTGLAPAERDAHLRTWAESPVASRRLAFRAVKHLSFLGYYSQDSTWAGIHYGGPWVPRPRPRLPE